MKFTAEELRYRKERYVNLPIIGQLISHIEELQTESAAKDALLVKIAEAVSDPRMSGPDGDAFGFCAPDYPEAPGAFAETQEKAAFEFLSELYP